MITKYVLTYDRAIGTLAYEVFLMPQCGSTSNLGPVYMIPPCRDISPRRDISPCRDTPAAYRNTYNFNFAFTWEFHPVPSCRDVFIPSRHGGIPRLAGMIFSM